MFGKVETPTVYIFSYQNRLELRVRKWYNPLKD